jgi:hypothetical protein
MRCPKCGDENRPEARFCKQCGQSLGAQAAPPEPPTIPGTVCPACGATARPRSRFCPRCGKPLQSEPPSLAPAPTAGDQTDAAPSPAPAPPVQPPQAPTSTAPERRSSRRLWWVGCVLVFVCIAALVTIAVVFGPRIIGADEMPAATGAPALVPTTEAASIPAFGAQAGIAASTAELQVGEPVTVTVAVTNTGQVTFGSLRYQLLGGWESYLRMQTDAVVEHELDIVPGQSDVAAFVLEAVQAGIARLQANVTVKTWEEPPSVKPVSSEDFIEISVIE